MSERQLIGAIATPFMDFVDAEDMFGGDDSDTGSDEADEPDEPAVSDLAHVPVCSGDEKDPPVKEEPAAVAAELRAAGGAQDDGGDDTGVGADGGSGGSSTAAASTDADGGSSPGDKTNTGGVGNNSAADGGGSAAGSGGGGGGGGLFGGKCTADAVAPEGKAREGEEEEADSPPQRGAEPKKTIPKPVYAGEADALYDLVDSMTTRCTTWPDIDKLNELIDAGIDLRYQGGSRKYTALIHASVKGYTAAVEAIVAADPDPDHIRMTEGDGYTALSKAADMGRPRIVEMLIKADPSGDHLNMKVG